MEGFMRYTETTCDLRSRQGLLQSYPTQLGYPHQRARCWKRRGAKPLGKEFKEASQG